MPPVQMPIPDPLLSGEFDAHIHDPSGTPTNVIRTEEVHKTKEYVVKRELSQQAGALYNVQQLQKDFRALNGLGRTIAIIPE